MKNPFRRTKVPHPDGLDSTFYVKGFVFDGGAENLAYINTRPHPLLTPFGGFLADKQLRVVEPQTVYQFNSLPVSPILPGIVAGQILTQSLTEQGQLNTTVNNELLNKNLFGGVQ